MKEFLTALAAIVKDELPQQQEAACIAYLIEDHREALSKYNPESQAIFMNKIAPAEATRLLNSDYSIKVTKPVATLTTLNYPDGASAIRALDALRASGNEAQMFNNTENGCLVSTLEQYRLRNLCYQMKEEYEIV